MNKLALVMIAAATTLAANPALAMKSCEELKTEIAAKVDAKGVSNYTLTIIGKDEPADGKVVGSCEGGAKAIVYKRG